MRKYLSFLLMVLSLVTFFACGSSDEETGKLKVDVRLLSSSPTEGAEMDVAMISQIVLSYNTTVIVDPSANITLNGQKVVAKSSAKDASLVEISVNLEANKDYTLSVPEKSIVSTEDKMVSAPSFTLKFKTRETSGHAPGLPDNEAVAMCTALGWGWNLGNHFDTSSGEDGKKVSWGWWDGAEPTKALYTNLAMMGAKSVRMPVTWGNYQDVKNNYIIEDNYMKLVEQNVKWALDAGLYVVLNTHHDEYWQDIIGAVADASKNKIIEDRIEKTWQQIATRFKDYGDHLIFETFNEIHDDSWGWTQGYNYKPVYNLLNEWNKIAVDVIRKMGGNNATRWIGIPGFCANPSFTMNNLVIPNGDKRIMVAVHSYDPFNFCTEGSVQKWGHVYRKNDNDENAVKALFDNLYNKYIKNNIPCYMGEYGAVKRKSADDEKYRSYYLEYFCRTAYYHGIPVMLWDNNNADPSGETFYFINHKDGSFYNENLVKLMIKAATSGDPNYTVKSVYDRAK